MIPAPSVNGHLSHVKCKRSSGFTLIELLVVLGILAITVSSTLLFLTSILRGSNKASITTEVKQNGQSVLDSLERQIRNASDAKPADVSSLASSDSKGVGGIALTLADVSNSTLYIVCFSHVNPNTNGWIGTSNSLAMSGFKAITNTDPVGGVDVYYNSSNPGDPANCAFNVPIGSLSAGPPVVNINFTLNQGVKAPSRQDFQANTQFQTTISLRKY